MNYKHGKIYSIRNTVDDDIYIGSTCQRLSQRMVKHRFNAKQEVCSNYRLYQKMNELGIDKFYIELVIEYPCENKDQLRAKEGEYIREVGTLNMLIAGRTTKHYREEHKEKMSKYQKVYRVENKDNLKQQKVEYRQRDDVIEKRKLKIVCSCGCQIRKEDIRRHERTKKHQEALNNLNINI